MADSIQIRGGNKADMPRLAEREPGWCKDSGELYIGTGDGNRKIADADVFRRLDDLESAVSGLSENVTALGTAMDGKLTASQAAAVADVAADAELADVINGVNSLIAALKASGIMGS